MFLFHLLLFASVLTSTLAACVAPGGTCKVKTDTCCNGMRCYPNNGAKNDLKCQPCLKLNEKCRGLADKRCCGDAGTDKPENILKCGRISDTEFACSSNGCANSGNYYFCGGGGGNNPGTCCSKACETAGRKMRCATGTKVGDRCQTSSDCFNQQYNMKLICVNYRCQFIGCLADGAACNPKRNTCCYRACRPNDNDPNNGKCSNDSPCVKENEQCGGGYEEPCCPGSNLFCTKQAPPGKYVGYYYCTKARGGCLERTAKCTPGATGAQACCKESTCKDGRCRDKNEEPICKRRGAKTDAGIECCSLHATTARDNSIADATTSDTQYCTCVDVPGRPCHVGSDCCNGKCEDFRCIA